jgi:hypothetical protein
MLSPKKDKKRSKFFEKEYQSTVVSRGQRYPTLLWNKIPWKEYKKLSKEE